MVLKVSGTYDYLNNAPYFGFKVQTTQGVSSPANSNGFSICKKIEKSAGPVTMVRVGRSFIQFQFTGPPSHIHLFHFIFFIF